MNGTPSTNPNRPSEQTLSLAAACGRIGPIGVAVRLIVGITLIVLALFWRDPHWRDAALGLLAFPGVIATALWLPARARRSAPRAVGPVAHLLNIVVAAVLFALPATDGADVRLLRRLHARRRAARHRRVRGHRHLRPAPAPRRPDRMRPVRTGRPPRARTDRRRASCLTDSRR